MFFRGLRAQLIHLKRHSEILHLNHLNTLIIPVTIPRPFLILLVFFVLFVLLLASLTVSLTTIFFLHNLRVPNQGLSSGVVFQGWQYALNGRSLLHLLLSLFPLLLLPLQSRLFLFLTLLLLLRKALLLLILVLIGGLRVHVLLLLLTSLFLCLLAPSLLEILLLVLSRIRFHSLLPSLSHFLEQLSLLFNGFLLAFFGNHIVLTVLILTFSLRQNLFVDGLSCIFL